jgi:hypothetical protein
VNCFIWYLTLYTKVSLVVYHIGYVPPSVTILRTLKVTVKLYMCFFLTEHHAMKAYWGSVNTASHIPDLSTRWRSVVSFKPQLFYPQGKSPWYPLDRRLSGTQSRSGCSGKEINSQLLPGLEPPIIQLVAQHYTTELYQLISILSVQVNFHIF